MKLRNRILLSILAVVVLIQFIQPFRNKSKRTLSTDITKTIKVPENVEQVLRSACYDCHSNNTVYPWYSRIQPFGWLLARHIKKGKSDLNFSDFGSYSVRQQTSKMNGIANSIKDETMPLTSYTMMHSNARLSKEDKLLLINWATRIKDSLKLNN